MRTPITRARRNTGTRLAKKASSTGMTN
jgi:hypothetical protein